MNWFLITFAVLAIVGILLALYFLVIKPASTQSSPGTGSGSGSGSGSYTPLGCPATDTVPSFTKALSYATVACPPGTAGTARALCKADGTYAAPETGDCKPMATLYGDINYAGDAWSFGPGEYDVDIMRLHLSGDNKASSAKVPPGCTLTVYDGAGFTGASQQFVGTNQPAFTDIAFNDKTSSLKYTCAPQLSGSGSGV